MRLSWANKLRRYVGWRVRGMHPRELMATIILGPIASAYGLESVFERNFEASLILFVLATVTVSWFFGPYLYRSISSSHSVEEPRRHRRPRQPWE
jgi:hypothetical protein